MIMKRQETLSDNVPFANSLIFYAPLTEGDLTDHVSGATGIPCIEGGTMPVDNLTWDAANGAYKFHTNTIYQNAARFSVPSFADLIAGIDCNDTAWCCNVKCSNNKCYYPIDIGYVRAGDKDNRDWGYTPTHLNHVGSYVFDGQWHRVAVFFLYLSTTVNFYVDGILRKSITSVYTGNSKVYKRGWTDNMKKYISLGVNQDGQGDITMWIKDMRLYNKTFTDSEITALI